ncbi:tail fiber domain-containing protein [Limosilactobacillus fermentum]|uniref:tail fiber domain-containing protein n=1 Tax=Limosilactobacillus fermentum TaxID=1613 RepID=UPI0021C9FC9B|nr:tail fiber domain-containing protein [Limosilactobacillus fermentum]
MQSVDDDKMLKMVNDTDLTTFLYKTDVANGETHRHIGPIIDDVHDVAQYQTPQDFIAPNGVSRDDDNMIGALFGAVKALTKRIKTLESKVG